MGVDGIRLRYRSMVPSRPNFSSSVVASATLVHSTESLPQYNLACRATAISCPVFLGVMLKLGAYELPGLPNDG
jgi:hypothetical protein